MVDINNISNTKVIESEKDYEFEGICGSDKGILLEDSLEQLFCSNNISVADYKEGESITLLQGEHTAKFGLFIGKEGSSYYSEHVNFDVAI